VVGIPTIGTPLSTTLFVNSSTNSGTPSVRYLGDDIIGQGFSAYNLLDQDGSVALVQTIEHQRRNLRLACPGRLELGPERHDQQNRQAADALNGKVEQLARGRVDPMRVLEHH
jgi:hypothetical protein